MYYTNIPGWFDFESFYHSIAIGLPNNAKIVEVGVWRGRSICFMAEILRMMDKKVHIYGVDTFLGSPTEDEHKRVVQELNTKYNGQDGLYQDFWHNITQAGVQNMIDIVRLPSVEAATKFEDESLDFVFIDAGHLYEDVKTDIDAWYPKVKIGGIISGHDYYVGNKDSEGVVRAVNEKFPRVQSTHSCWFQRKN